MSSLRSNILCAEDYGSHGYCRNIETQYKIMIPNEIMVVLCQFIKNNFLWMKLICAGDASSNIDYHKYKFRCFPITDTEWHLLQACYAIFYLKISV